MRLAPAGIAPVDIPDPPTAGATGLAGEDRAAPDAAPGAVMRAAEGGDFGVPGDPVRSMTVEAGVEASPAFPLAGDLSRPEAAESGVAPTVVPEPVAEAVAEADGDAAGPGVEGRTGDADAGAVEADRSTR